MPAEFAPEPVATMPMLKTPGWELAGNFAERMHARLRADALGNRRVGELVAAQLAAERPDVLSRVRLLCTDARFACYALRRADIAEVADILAGLSAGRIGPVDVPDTAADDAAGIESQPLD